LVNIGQPLVTSVNLYEAKTRLSELVDAAHEGDTIVIARSGRPLATLDPLPTRKQPIRLGLMKGKLRIAADFDAPLPENILEDFEGRLRPGGGCWTPILSEAETDT